MSYSRRQLYAFGEPLGDSVTRKEGGRIVYGDGGGGGSPSSSQTQISELPEWAKGYAKDALAKTGALTDTTQNPYQTYGKDRIAGFSPLQQQSQQNAANMQTSPQTAAASNMAQQAGLQALNTQYQGGQFQNQFQAPGQYNPAQVDMYTAQAPNLQNYQMDQAQQVRGAQARGAQTNYDPNLQQYQMGPAQQVQGAQAQAAQTGYDPSLRQYQMGPAEQVRTQSFAAPGSAEAYMSPYMQNVVDVQQREAQRQADIAGTQLSSQATKSGAFGGGRQAIMQAEAARNLAQQKGDIQATGSQAAYQQAQQQFNAEQAARLQAQQANQGAGLTVGSQNLASRLGVQQLGTQTGLQTALANMQAQQGTSLANQQTAQQAALANQQAGLSTEQANLQSRLGVQQLGTQTGLQTSLANQQTSQAAGMQNAQLRQQAALANQQAGLSTGQANLQANLGVQQLGSGQSMQAQLANQNAFQAAQQLAEQSRQYGAGYGMTAAQNAAQYGQSAQQLAEQSRQYGAGLGMQGLQTGLQASGQLGTLGGQQFAQGMDINKLQNAYGGQQQALQQQGLSQAYQDFQNQQNYPYKQLGFMSDMIRGLPLGQQTTSQMYEAQPGMAQQLGSLGMGAYGLSKFMAEGGAVQSYAGGGDVDSAENVADIVSSLSPQQLQQSLEAAQARGDSEQERAILDEMGFQASLSRGLAGTVTPGMAQRMAGGGVVAFAGGGLQDTLRGLSALGGKEITNTPEERQAGITAALPGIKAMYGESALAPIAKEVSAERKALDAKGDIPAEFFFGAAKGILKGRNLVAGLANAGIEGGEAAVKAKKEAREASRLLRASEIQLATADQQRQDGQIAKAENSYEKGKASAEKALERTIDVQGKIATIQSSGENARLQAATSAAASAKPTDLDKQTKIRYAAALEAGEPPNAATMSKAAQQAASDLGRYPGEARSEAAGAKLDQAALQKAREAVDNAKMSDPVWRAAKTAKDTAAMERRENEMIAQRMKAPAGAAPAAAPGAVAKPSMQVFMDAARKANPGVSDADLAAYYNSKYK